MDEYVMLLETHRIKVSFFIITFAVASLHPLNLIWPCFVLPCLVICLLQLVAKLKSIFDRFDASSVGRLSGAQVEQMLVYMNRPIESVQVREWLLKLKEKEDTVEFPEFVAQYSVSCRRFSWTVIAVLCFNFLLF
jgi:hypothetical protein